MIFRELYNPGTHLLQNLIDLVESAVPSIEPRRMPPSEGQNTMPETDLLASVDCQTGLQRAVTPPNDNFGNNFRSPPFSSPQLPKYLPVASGYSVSNQMAQFDSLTPNLSSSLFGTPPVTPTSHLPPGNLQSDSQSVKPSSSVMKFCDLYIFAKYQFILWTETTTI